MSATTRPRGAARAEETARNFDHLPAEALRALQSTLGNWLHLIAEGEGPPDKMKVAVVKKGTQEKFYLRWSKADDHSASVEVTVDTGRIDVRAKRVSPPGSDLTRFDLTWTGKKE